MQYTITVDTDANEMFPFKVPFTHKGITVYKIVQAEGKEDYLTKYTFFFGSPSKLINALTFSKEELNQFKMDLSYYSFIDTNLTFDSIKAELNYLISSINELPFAHTRKGTDIIEWAKDILDYDNQN